MDEDTTPAEKNEIVRVILLNPQSTDIPVLRQVFDNSETPLQKKSIIAMIFGTMGAEKELEIMRNSLAANNDDNYAVMINTAIALIEERTKEADPE